MSQPYIWHKKETIVVFCVRCKLPVGEMHYPDIGLQCREICLPCYEYLADRAARYEALDK